MKRSKVFIIVNIMILNRSKVFEFLAFEIYVGNIIALFECKFFTNASQSENPNFFCIICPTLKPDFLFLIGYFPHLFAEKKKLTFLRIGFLYILEWTQ